MMLVLTACHAETKAEKADAEAQQIALVVQAEIDKADADAQYAAKIEPWKAKTRKACGLKPGELVFPKTKRAMLEDCNAKVRAGLPNAAFPPLPPDSDTTGLSSADGCRYFLDSYVDTQGVRARFRCKYDPTMLGTAEWEMLK